jgi:hypothetical protein
MDSPKDKANDPKRKAVNNHTDAELLEKFNQIHANVMAQPVIKNWEYDTREGSFGPDGNRLDVPSRSWSMPNGK